MLNSKSAARDSRINLAAKPLKIAKVNKLDMTVQRGNLAVGRFKSDKLDVAKFRILLFRGDELDITTRTKKSLLVLKTGTRQFRGY